MGTALTGTQIKNSYLDVCQFGNSGAGVTSAPLAICDGGGNASQIAISTVNIQIGPAPNRPVNNSGHTITSPTSGKTSLVVTGSPAQGNGDGALLVADRGGESILFVSLNGSVTIGPSLFMQSGYGYVTRATGNHFSGGSGTCINWANNADFFNGTADVSIYRSAAGVVSVGTGAVSGFGWINDAGIARNTADVANATTTFATLPDLTINVLAGRKYIGVVKIKCNNSTSAEGIKFDFNGGTATITSFWAAASEMVGGTTVLGTVISTSLAGVINYTTITGETLIEITLSFVVNAAGTLIPRFAENSHAAGTATVELGSFIRLDDSPN